MSIKDDFDEVYDNLLEEVYVGGRSAWLARVSKGERWVKQISIKNQKGYDLLLDVDEELDRLRRRMDEMLDSIRDHRFGRRAQKRKISEGEIKKHLAKKAAEAGT